MKLPDPYAAPPAPAGCLTYLWRDQCAEPLVAHVAYTPAEGDNWNTPYLDSFCELVAVYARGLDISSLLDSDTCEDIAEKARIELESSRCLTRDDYEPEEEGA